MDLINIASATAVEVVGYGRRLDLCCRFWMSADTIGSLKAQIKERFSLTDNDLNQRLLVPDNRTDLQTPSLVNAQDLLEVEEGSLLNLVGLKEGDKLTLGWKVPFTISLYTVRFTRKSHSVGRKSITVSCYDTVGDLKTKIEEITREPVTEDNLPQPFFSEDVNKQTLLAIGLYSMIEPGGDFSIIRNRNNSFII